MLAGRATPEGTAHYRDRHPLPDHFRRVGGLWISSVGHGSYLGATDPATRTAYTEAALRCLHGGVNVLDTASNYRDQASERDVGRALAAFVADGGARDEVLVCTKVGFLHGDVDSGMRTPDWVQQEHVLPGHFRQGDIAANCHVMTPAYIRDEVARSRRNLGVETLDVVYLHNPETRLAAGWPQDRFWAEVETACMELERLCDEGAVQVYGVATWDGLRVPPDHPAHLALVKMVHAAGAARTAVGGTAKEHHFRAVQVPVNLAMTEGIQEPMQAWRFDSCPAVQAAKGLGMFVAGSASLAQARIQVPAEWKEALGAGTDVEALFRFARSAGTDTALVGLGSPEHADQVLKWCRRPPQPGVVKTMLGSGWGHD